MSEKILKKVIKHLSKKFKGAVDYHTEDGEKFLILDKKDRVIGKISEREMTKIWNMFEGWGPSDESEVDDE